MTSRFLLTATVGLVYGTLLPLFFAGSHARGCEQDQTKAAGTILPGFEPVRLVGTTVHTYSKSYVWDDSYLPTHVESIGGALAEDMQFVHRFAGGEEIAKPDTVKVLEACPDRVTIHASGILADGTKLTVISRVDYDGVATVRVAITPPATADIGGLDFRVRLASTDNTEILGFKATGIRKQKERRDLVEVPYQGEFINVLNFSDGDRSFWWFADNAQGWIWNDSTVTEVVRERTGIQFRQRIVGRSTRIDQPLSLEFGFLATPVTDSVVTPPRIKVIRWSDEGLPSAEWEMLRLWWPTAFAYDAFPYTDYVQDEDRRLSRKDVEAYPGLIANRKLIDDFRRNDAIHLLPYFSLHALSLLDPVLERNRSAWEVSPPMIYRDGLAPYSNDFPKIVVTHRAEGFSDYLLERLTAELRNLGAIGIYLDHGPPRDSINLKNGGWIDSRGRLQPSLDIFATRNFLRRLRENLPDLHSSRHLVVHVSNREIVPAYTFATALVSGEQFRGVVTEGKYLDYLTIDEFRARFAPSQYGIPTIFLPTEWTRFRGDATWPSSAQAVAAYRRTEGLALLHNLVIWPVGPQPPEWNSDQAFLDCFGIAEASFEGYWSQSIAEPNSEAVKVSIYRNQLTDSLLLIAINNSAISRKSRVTLNIKEPRSEGWKWISLDGDSGVLTDNSISATMDAWGFNAWTVRPAAGPALQRNECAKGAP